MEAWAAEFLPLEDSVAPSFLRSGRRRMISSLLPNIKRREDCIVESIGVNLPSGAAWRYRDTLTHGARRRLEKVGRRAAFATLAEVRDAGVDVEQLLGKADRQANAAVVGSNETLTPEQEDALIIQGTIDIRLAGGNAEPLTQLVLDDMESNDVAVMLETLLVAYGYKEPEQPVLPVADPLPDDVPSEPSLDIPASPPEEEVVAPTG